MEIVSFQNNVFFTVVQVKHSATIDLGIYIENRDDFDKCYSLMRQVGNCSQNNGIYISCTFINQYGQVIVTMLKDNSIKVIKEIVDIVINNVCFRGKNLLVLTGDFSDEIKQYIIEKAGSLEKRQVVPVLEREKSYLKVNDSGDMWKDIAEIYKNFRLTEIENDEILDIKINFSMTCLQKKLYPAAVLLSSILAEGDGSILNLSLREKYAYTDEIVASAYWRDSKIGIRLECFVKLSYLLATVREIWNTILHLKKHLNQNNLDEVKLFYTERVDTWYDDTYRLNQWIGQAFMTGMEEFCDPERMKMIFESISIEDIQKLADELLKEENVKINYCVD